jgi:hypothetical protein
MKKVIKIGFNDQASEQYKNKKQSPYFCPQVSTQDSRAAYQKAVSGTIVRTFGDDRANVYSPYSSLNFKNDYEKRILALTESYDVRENIKTVDNSDHYFNTHHKHIRLMILGLSGSSHIYSNQTNQFNLTGGLELSQSLYDANYTLISSATFLTHFGQNHTTVGKRYEAVLTFRVSGTNTNFAANEISFEFRDYNSSLFSTYTNVARYGSYFPTADGWYDFIMAFPYDNVPTFSLNETQPYFRLSGGITTSGGKIFAFRDIKLSFNQKLTDDGVKYYQDLDNQNNKDIETFINRSVAARIS